jgi:hypothetical protein
MLSKLAEFKKLIFGGGAVLAMVLAGVVQYGTGVLPGNWLIAIQGVLGLLALAGIYKPDGPVAVRLKALGKPVPTHEDVRRSAVKLEGTTGHHERGFKPTPPTE